jgi:thioredoxin-like negative regulator of GroEL
VDHGVALLRWASSAAPADSAIRYHLAVAYRAAGQPDEAVKLLTPLVAAPDDFSEKPQAKQLLAALSGKP